MSLRGAFLSFFIVFFGSSGPSVFAARGSPSVVWQIPQSFSPGDQGLVTHTNVPLMIESKLIGYLPSGITVKIERSISFNNINWLWVSYRESKGWVQAIYLVKVTPYSPEVEEQSIVRSPRRSTTEFRDPESGETSTFHGVEVYDPETGRSEYQYRNFNIPGVDYPDYSG